MSGIFLCFNKDKALSSITLCISEGYSISKLQSRVKPNPKQQLQVKVKA